MACRGVHFAIAKEECEKLLSAKTDESIIEIIQEGIEEEWNEEWLCETDKAWDAIHRCLTNGKLECNENEFPLNTVILCGKQLHKSDDYIISLIEPEKVSAVSDALQNINEKTLKLSYEKINQNDYDGEIGKDDFEYTWEYFMELPKLFSKAAKAGRAIVFTVDQ